MIRSKRFRIAGLLLLAAALFAVLPAFAQKTERARRLGKQMKCMCGCNQVLTECNHVGCKYSHDMLAELDARVARNEPDNLTLQAFVQEYGPSVLLVPPAHGFDLWAWIMPVLVPLLGLWLVRVAIVRWRHRAALSPAPHVSTEMLDRVHRDEHEWGDV
jgi:cytochrome c-type biogenesis protein CcmH/NrfF